MSIYLVNGEMIELSVNNPTAADLKRHFGSSSEDSLVIINWPDGSQQMLADQAAASAVQNAASASSTAKEANAASNEVKRLRREHLELLSLRGHSRPKR